tara:strand:- start:1594 stop:2031 length:438 start_codon:yes stop_codon:yes gene_type:complete
MQLKNTIDIQIKESMLNKNKSRLIALRAIKSAILLNEKSGEGADLDEIKLLMKLIKQRKDSLKLYLEQNRQDLANTEQVEIDIIEEFLPKQLTDEDLEKEIEIIIKEIGAESMKDMGKVMASANKKLSGKADSSRIAGLVKSKLI